MRVWSRHWRALLLVGAASTLWACGGDDPTGQDGPDAGNLEADGGHQPGSDGGTTGEVIVDLRADVNRDGVVSLDDDADEAGEDAWTAERGAIFLANLDDDTERCPVHDGISDEALAKCHDAADDVINGDDDLLDLAYLRTVPWAQAPEGTTASVSVSASARNYVRIFFSDGNDFVALGPASVLPAQFVRDGLELAIEGKDIVRNAQVWDGYVDVTFTINVPEGHGALSGMHSDTVRMRVSPVMTFHHLLPAEQLFVSHLNFDSDSVAFVKALDSLVANSGMTVPFTRDAQSWDEEDQWIQDYFETGFMSMPASGGKQHVIRVNFRSANVDAPEDPDYPLRWAGRYVFELRGKDTAAIQQFSRDEDAFSDTLNSFGNTETIPPYTHNGVSYPLGRLYRGSVPTFFPDRSWTQMSEAQRVQPPVYVDTSWLVVAHVDETISFLKVNSPRGWVVLANDPTLARQMLEDEVQKGNGGVQMFVGKRWLNNSGREVNAAVSISQVLANTNVMAESAASAIEVDAQLDIIKAETGITDEEIIRVPFLHQNESGYSLAYQPGTVNLLVVDDQHVIAPDPFGPVIDGKDIFKVQLEQALQPHGYTVHWIDNWDLYHRLSGEVHCGTNAARAIPEAKWWESGR